MNQTNTPKKSQAQSVSGSRVLFLTQQQQTFSPIRKKQLQVKQFAQQVQNSDLFQMNKICDSLLQQVSQLKTQQVLSMYRQVNRNISQSYIEKQGEMNKLEKVMKIDVGFLRKKLENQPVIDFGYLNERVSIFQKDANHVSQIIQGYNQKVNQIQKQFG